MKRSGQVWKAALGAVVLALVTFGSRAIADPAKYPQFAQQSLPKNVTATFVSVDAVVGEIKAGKQPFIIDVRTVEEFRDARIAGAVSAPLSDFHRYVTQVPKDRLVVLY